METVDAMKEFACNKILVVDDSRINLEILDGLLKSSYEVYLAQDGKKALELVRKIQPDLVLLDVMMPGMDGFEVCSELKRETQTEQIPVIFLTALADTQHKTKGFSLGAVDYILKPFDALEVQSRIRTHLSLRRSTLELQNQNIILERKVRERTREIALTQEATIESLASLAEYRDPETGGHIQRTKNYVRLLAARLRSHPGFSDQLSDSAIELLEKCAPLHDIGKVGVPDHILQKPGRLTMEEMDEMKKHTLYGYEAIMAARKKIGMNVPFLTIAAEIALTHHERWDGSGYPHGLSGEDIPVPGRLMALADVYDALISRRVYKPPFPHERAVAIIANGDGRTQPGHFDPAVVEAFLAVEGEFYQAALRYCDSDEESSILVA
jgi:putative two-component system response regulator